MVLLIDRYTSLEELEQAGRLIALDARTNLYCLKLKKGLGHERVEEEFLEIIELLDSVTERVKILCAERAKHGGELAEFLREEANRLEAWLSKNGRSS
jgi:hypothetical protein